MKEEIKLNEMKITQVIFISDQKDFFEEVEKNIPIIKRLIREE